MMDVKLDEQLKDICDLYAMRAISWRDGHVDVIVDENGDVVDTDRAYDEAYTVCEAKIKAALQAACDKGRADALK